SGYTAGMVSGALHIVVSAGTAEVKVPGGSIIDLGPGTDATLSPVNNANILSISVALQSGEAMVTPAGTAGAILSADDSVSVPATNLGPNTSFSIATGTYMASDTDVGPADVGLATPDDGAPPLEQLAE